MVELISQFDKGEVKADHISNYFYRVKQAYDCAKVCCSHAKSMDNRLKQIAEQLPVLIDSEEYKNLFSLVDFFT
jgi:hypothetical protein